MILITSAAYLDQEFASEFGRMPPAFLPVGNKRLYHHQVSKLPREERKVLTVPESYRVGDDDQVALRELQVELLAIPDGLSLGDSVVCAINLASLTPGEPLRILHGDTLIVDWPAVETDAIGLSEVDGNYNWAVWTGDSERLLSPLDDTRLARGPVQIANGYFSFSDSALLVRSITRMRGNFIDGISLYAREKQLEPLVIAGWLDFGHIHTFYRSKSQMTTQRAFNEMAIGAKTVIKKSDEVAKMRAEANWFRSLPDDLKVHTPHFIREIAQPGENGYEIEYLYLTTLNELFVFGTLPRFVWRRIFTSCFDFLDHCRVHSIADDRDMLADLYRNKTLERLNKLAAEQDVDLDAEWSINGLPTPGLLHIANATAEIIESIGDQRCCVSHGDFCFSNILYDFRTEGVKVIDPRGLDSRGCLTIHGSQLYDLGKLAHSAIGLYDFIIAGSYTLSRRENEIDLTFYAGDSHRQIQTLFHDMVAQRFALTAQQLAAMQVHLFLSMLPLHNDDPKRQLAMLANALRLYAGIEESP